LRQLIQTRLADFRASTDPLARTLAEVEGTATPDLLECLRHCQPSAVLVGLVEREAELNVLLTQRSARLSAHAGQVSFPGGRLEPGDAGPAAAALREAHEEIGLPAQRVEVVGELDTFLTATGFQVTPVVGFIDAAFEPIPDVNEVDAVFEVPLSFLLDPHNVATVYRERMGARFKVYEIRYGGRYIWGATASILMNLREVISI
jgi:8-oxo-dGTP pyrophosphatase MutT (NUDIX family)